MNNRPSSLKLSVALLSCVLFLTGCAATSPVLLPIEPPKPPPLPNEARQEDRPSWCSPNCIEALTQRRLSWLQRLNALVTEDLHAKPRTTP